MTTRILVKNHRNILYVLEIPDVSQFNGTLTMSCPETPKLLDLGDYSMHIFQIILILQQKWIKTILIYFTC